MRFLEKLEKVAKKNKSLVCLGLDSDIEKIPKNFQNNRNKPIQFLFNKSIIDRTFSYVCSYKFNVAFYYAIGLKGLQSLKLTIDYLKKNHPEIPVIVDAKIGDINNTNKAYAQFIFDYLGADGVTVNPYLGEESLRPFLVRKDKGIIVISKTSNPGAQELQNLPLEIKDDSLRKKMKEKIPLYQYIVYQVVYKWNKNKNCLLVVGATYPNELKEIRRMVGDQFWFLVPGIGAQGGDLEATVKAGLNRQGNGLIIHSSRAIIYDINPQKQVLKLKKEINKLISSYIIT